MGYPFSVCKARPLYLLFICFLCPEYPLLCRLLLTWPPLTPISGLDLGHFLAKPLRILSHRARSLSRVALWRYFYYPHCFLPCVSSGLCNVFYSLLHVSRYNLHRLKCSAIKSIVQSVAKKEHQGTEHFCTPYTPF